MRSIEPTIIICAYNEENTVVEGVRACRQLNQQSEIIVVDDGSTDRTPALLAGLKTELGFRYERFSVNRGKSAAMAHGVAMASNEIILFVDADVSGLREEHFHAMMGPLTAGTADMVLGRPTKTLVDYRIIPFKSLTGERSLFKKDIQPILHEMREIRYGAETLINLYFKTQGKRTQYVLLEGLLHPNKYAKTDPLRASKELLGAGKDIAATLARNHNLVAKRVEMIVRNSSREARRKVVTLHEQVNEKVDDFIDRLMQ